MKDPLKPRDKITQKMSRDGLIEVNETKETAERISRREQETDFSKQPEQAAQDTAAQLTSPGTFQKNDTGKAERVMEHIGAAQTRQASKSAVRRAQEEAAANGENRPGNTKARNRCRRKTCQGRKRNHYPCF